jgi:hypothetical protein
MQSFIKLVSRSVHIIDHHAVNRQSAQELYIRTGLIYVQCSLPTCCILFIFVINCCSGVFQL